MQGLMMETPLLISSILEHAAFAHGDQEIVSKRVEGDVHRYTYTDALRRSKQLANALTALGVQPADRLGTIAWNGYRHFEIYYAVSGMGAICHTLNPRLHASQREFIINHADDRYIFVDTTFVGQIEEIEDQLPGLAGVIVMTDRDRMPATPLKNAICYEELIESASDELVWPTFDEDTASSICYTSGTTGDPKGVLYSHRSTVLHSYAIALPDSASLGERDAILPVVPMFHVNAWGIPYAAPLTGAKLVFPGPALDGPSLYELIQAEGVTVSGAVPTVWLGLLQHLRTTGEKLESMKRVIIGGSAAPDSMIRELQEEHEIEVRHAWGMTETSPLGTISVPKPRMDSLPPDERRAVQGKQGRPVYGIELRIVDEEGNPLPHDGKAFGELLVRGPWVNRAYFRIESSPTHTEDGWFATGDVATIDPDGYMKITDRTKDLIKSGGEWISSIDLENLVMNHADVAQAAVIAIPDDKWDERPLLIVVPESGREVTAEAIREFLSGQVAKWWLPDDVVFAESLPIGATGKVLKTELRERYGRQ